MTSEFSGTPPPKATYDSVAEPKVEKIDDTIHDSSEADQKIIKSDSV